MPDGLSTPPFIRPTSLNGVVRSAAAWKFVPAVYPPKMSNSPYFPSPVIALKNTLRWLDRRQTWSTATQAIKEQDMLTRRDFLKASALTGPSLMLPLALGSRYAHAARPFVPPVSPVLTKYLDQVPIPGTVAPVLNPVTSFYELALTMAAASTYSFHTELGPAQTHGYGGAPYLGPTIIAHRGQPIKMTATNALGPHPMTAMVTPDPLNVMGVQPEDAASPRAAVHLHGGYNRHDSDGGPLEYFPRNPDPQYAGNSFTYTWANDQQAANLWYHDHAYGTTRANVYAGLAGYYLLRDEYDTGDTGNPVGLPA